MALSVAYIQCVLILPYSSKFSRVKIFADFADRSQSAKILTRENFNPGIPGVCEWYRTVLARSGRGLGADANAWPISENFNLQKFLAKWYLWFSLLCSWWCRQWRIHCDHWGGGHRCRCTAYCVAAYIAVHITIQRHHPFYFYTLFS